MKCDVLSFRPLLVVKCSKKIYVDTRKNLTIIEQTDTEAQSLLKMETPTY